MKTLQQSLKFPQITSKYCVGPVVFASECAFLLFNLVALKELESRVKLTKGDDSVPSPVSLLDLPSLLDVLTTTFRSQFPWRWVREYVTMLTVDKAMCTASQSPSMLLLLLDLGAVNSIRTT